MRPLSYQPLSRLEQSRIKDVYPVKKVDRHFYLDQDLRFLCLFLNELHENKGPVLQLTYEQERIRLWTQRVIAPLCPTVVRKSKDGCQKTWQVKAQESIGLYWQYFGKWAEARLNVKPSRVKGSFRCSLLPDNLKEDEHYMAVKIWDVIFLQEGFKRLKRCMKCEKWFIDRGKNRIARFCSASCTNRYWNKQRRLDSPNYGKRKKRKKGRLP
jgi:hypothetical protein